MKGKCWPPLDESLLGPSESEFLPGIFLNTCSAEDLIVHKAFAARGKDWIDIEGVILRQKRLYWEYIESQLKPLHDLKEEPENWQILVGIKTKASKRQRPSPKSN